MELDLRWTWVAADGENLKNFLDRPTTELPLD
jgi:hypothetical protein